MNKTKLQEIIERYKVESSYITYVIERLKEVKNLTLKNKDFSNEEREEICLSYAWAGIGRELNREKKFESGVESRSNLTPVSEDLLISNITGKPMTKKTINLGTVLVNNKTDELDRMVYNYGNGVYPVNAEVYVPNNSEIPSSLTVEQLLRLVKSNKVVLSAVNVQEDQRQDYVNQKYSISHNTMLDLQDKLAFDKELQDYIFYGIYFPYVDKESSFKTKVNYYSNIYSNFNNAVVDYLKDKIDKDIENENAKLNKIKSFYKQRIKKEVKSQERDILNAKKVLSEEFER